MSVNIPIRWATNTEDLRKQLKAGLDQIVATEAGAKKLMDSLSGERMVVAAHKYAAAISEIGGASKLTTAEATRANAVFDKAIEKYRVMGNALGPMPEVLQKIAAETKNVAEAEKKAAEAADAAKKAHLDFLKAAEEEAAGLIRQAKEMEAAQTAAFKRTTDGLYGLAQGAKTVGAGLTAAITVPLAGMAIAGARASAPFEATMQRLVTIAGVSSQELAGVKDHLLALAPAVGIGPQALADAMMIVSSTVTDTNVALQITETAAKGAAAGLGEAAVVGRALTAVINSYGAATIDAARAGDILTMAIKDGGAEAKELAPVIGNVVPLAAQLGVTFEEVGANIATVTRLGIPAAEAVTQLSSVFSGLLKETTKGREALKSIGMTYAELREEVKTKGLLEALTHLNEAFGEHKEQLTKVFGRIEALRDVMSTAGQQADTYREILDHMKNSVGTLQGAFDKMKGTQIQTWNELRAALDVLAVRIGDALAPSLVKALDSMKPLVDTALALVQAFAALPEPVRETLILFGGFGAVLGPAIYLLGQLAGSVRELMLAYKAIMASEGLIAFMGLLAAPEVIAAAGIIGGIALAIGGVALAANQLGEAFERIDRSPSAGKLLNGQVDQKGNPLFSGESAKASMQTRSGMPGAAGLPDQSIGPRQQGVLGEFSTGFTLSIPSLQRFGDAAKDAARWTGDLLDQVEKLTAAERALILEDKKRGLSTLDISNKERIPKDVVATFLRQVSASASTKKDPWAEYASASGPAYLDILNKIGNQTYEGIAYDSQRIKSVETLAKVYGTTTTVVQEVIASEAQYAAAAKRNASTAEDVAALWVKANAAQEASGEKGPTAAIEKINQQQALDLSKWSQHLQSKKITLEDYAEAVDAIDTRADAQRRVETQKLADQELLIWTKNQNDIEAIRQQTADAQDAEGATGLRAHVALIKKHADAEKAAWKQRLDTGKVLEGQYWEAIGAIEDKERQLATNKEIEANRQNKLTQLKAEQDYSEALAKLTMSDTDFQIMQMRRALEEERQILMLRGGNWQEAFEAIKKNVDLQIFQMQHDINKGWLGGIANMAEAVGGALKSGGGIDKAWAAGIGAVANTLFGKGGVWDQKITDNQKRAAAATIESLNAAAAAMPAGSRQQGTLSWAATGAGIGSMIMPGWGTAIGAVAGGLYGFFKKPDDEKEAENELKIFQRAMADLFDATANQSEKAATATDDWAKMVGTVADAYILAGYTAEDARKALQQLADDTRDHVERVPDDIRAIQKVLQESNNFAQLAGQSAILNSRVGIIDEHFVTLLKHARELGRISQSMKDFVGAQSQDAASGFVSALKVTNDAYTKRKDLLQQIADATKEMEGQSGDSAEATAKKIKDLNEQLDKQNKIIALTGITQGTGDAIAGGLLGAVAGQVEAGMSYGDAIRSIAPAVASMQTQLNAMGIGGGDTFDFLNAQVKLFTDEVTGPAMTAMEGYAQGLRGLGNAGMLDQKTFGGIAEQITRTHDALIAQGVSGPQLLTAMQGPLQTLWELEQKFGFKADEATQALIDQAVANGEVGEKMKPIQEQMLDTMQEVADAVNALVKALGGVPAAAKDAADSMKFPPVTVPIVFEGKPPTNTGGGASTAARGGLVTTTGMRYLAEGGLASWESADWFKQHGIIPQIPTSVLTGLFKAKGTDTVPAMLTPGEGIVTKAGMDRLGAAALAGLNAHGGGLDPAELAAREAVMLQQLDHWSGTDLSAHGSGEPAIATISAKTEGSAHGGEVHYHTWKIAITALDQTDLRRKVETEILPMVIDELEDNRRASARRVGDAIQRART